MRNTLSVLVAGMMLAGCLSTDEPQPDEETAAGTDTTGNNSPEISGKPGSFVLYNQQYAFKPSASDADGDTLTFEIRNKPSWASFNSSNGWFGGSPSMADIGVHDQIVISVTDGEFTQSLPAFSVTVNDVALGSVTLNWVAPTENTDGSALVDLAGYVIHYGNAPGVYDQMIEIDNPSITTYVVDNLNPDMYYFAATSVNAAGVESDLSSEAVFSVN